jgi:hypothetical protein
LWRICHRHTEKDFWDALSHHPLLDYYQQVYSRGELIAANTLEPPGEENTTVLPPQMENWGIELVVTIPRRYISSGRTAR